MQRLIDRVYGRPVAVFCQGPSVGEVTQDDYDALRRAGVVIGSVNRFWLTGFTPDILWVAADQRIRESYQLLADWLWADHRRLLLTRPKALALLEELCPASADLKFVRKQIIPFFCEEGPSTEDTVHLFRPVAWEVISIAAMVLALYKAGANRIGVFGHDGGTDYFGHTDKATTVDRDIDNLNMGWGELCYNTDIDPKTIRVRNGNLKSRCIRWPRCTQQELIRWLTY